MAQDKPRYVLAVHGGAGVYSPEEISAAQYEAYHQGLRESLTAGEAMLAQGGSALDAVEAAVRVLEDNPLFNAGRGAVLNAQGQAELDAAIMDGRTLKAGGVAGVQTSKNPISAARAVMDNSEFVLLAREGADAFAHSQGLAQVANSYFLTPTRVAELAQAQSSHALYKKLKLGTVGAVALDVKGDLAAATSTGGMTNKRWGRIGDSPLIGAGTYAENGICAVSGTGWGEYFIRTSVAKSIGSLIEHKAMDAKSAARQVLEKVARLGGDGGVIVVDAQGEVALEFNTPGMFRGFVRQGELLTTAILRTQ
jgi:L-asparaginase / beta-aspartyl-peptidase